MKKRVRVVNAVRARNTSHFAVGYCSAQTNCRMSQVPTVNVVDDEEMSSQGSVNAPVALPQSPIGQIPTSQVPTEEIRISPHWHPIATQQSRTVGSSRSVSPTVLAQSTEVVATPTVVVDAPMRAKTKQAFAEVSSALQQASSAHEEVHSEVQSLAIGIEELRKT